MGELSEATNRDRPTEPMAVIALREGQCCAPARTNYRSTTLRPAGESPRRLRATRQVVRAASTGIDSKILITTLARGDVRHPLPLWRRAPRHERNPHVRWGPLRPGPGLRCYVPFPRRIAARACSGPGSHSHLLRDYGTDLQRSRTVRFVPASSGYASHIASGEG